MIGEKDVERAAAVQRLNVRHDALERYVIGIVTINAVQARGPTSHVVGLRLDDEAELGRCPASGRTFALALDAHPPPP
jgi:hypothetical protein